MDSIPAHFPCRRLFESDWESLSDLELVALLIGPGTPERRALNDARRLLDVVGPSRRLQDAGYEELCRAGLSRKKALALLAAVQLSRRFQKIPLFPGQSFRSSLEIFRHFQPLVHGLKKECFWSVLLDSKNRILRVMFNNPFVLSYIASPHIVWVRPGCGLRANFFYFARAADSDCLLREGNRLTAFL